MKNESAGFTIEEIVAGIKKTGLVKKASKKGNGNGDGNDGIVYSTGEKRKKYKRDDPEGMWRNYIQMFNGGAPFIGMKRIFTARMEALNHTIRDCSLEDTSKYFKKMWPHWFKACNQAGCDKPCRSLLTNIILKLCLPEHIFFVDMPLRPKDGPRYKTVAVGLSKTASVDVSKKEIYCAFHSDRPYHSLIGSKELPVCKGCRIRLEDGAVAGIKGGGIGPGMKEEEIYDWLRIKALNDNTPDQEPAKKE